MNEKFGQFDVIIVGAGPAGIAAALWCDDLKLTSCLVERSSEIGGQLHWIHNPISNYPGTQFAGGSDAAHRFKKSLAGRSVTVKTDAHVLKVDVNSRSVFIEGEQPISGKAIVLATGVRRRQLGVAGEAEFHNKGVLESGSRDRRDASGKRVAVIGGGDAALENALILAEHAEKVHVIHRRERFSARKEFIKSVKASDRIEAVLNARVKEFGGSEGLEFIDIELVKGGSQRIAIENAVVRIGVLPNSELLAGTVDLDDAGYVIVDRIGQTSATDIYAVGDVAFPESPTIATSVGTAATAIKHIASKIRLSE